MTNLQEFQGTAKGGKFFSFDSLKEVLQKLDNSLVKGTRENGQDYFYLSNDLDPDLRDQFQTIIRECHAGEFPNDWRFSTVKEICFTCLEYDLDGGINQLDQILDNYISEIVDGIVDISTSRLFQWLADIPSRSEFTDGPYGEDLELSKMAAQRQYEEIDFIAHTLLNSLNDQFV